MKGYYIKEIRTWTDKRYYGIEEMKVYGKRKKSAVQPITSKSISGLYLFTSKKIAERTMEKLQDKAKTGWYESKWELICEDIQ